MWLSKTFHKAFWKTPLVDTLWFHLFLLVYADLFLLQMSCLVTALVVGSHHKDGVSEVILHDINLHLQDLADSLQDSSLRHEIDNMVELEIPIILFRSFCMFFSARWTHQYKYLWFG